MYEHRRSGNSCSLHNVSISHRFFHPTCGGICIQKFREGRRTFKVGRKSYFVHGKKWSEDSRRYWGRRSHQNAKMRSVLGVLGAMKDKKRGLCIPWMKTEKSLSFPIYHISLSVFATCHTTKRNCG